jgi:hypothetical protein
MQTLMRSKYYVVMLMMLACVTGAVRADIDYKRPAPGAEYKGGKKALKKREFRKVRIGDLVEGSPEWVLYQALISMKKGDVIEMGKYFAPYDAWSASRLRPDEIDGLNPYRLGLDDDVAIADGQEEAEWCYIYITFLQTDGLGRMGGYHYFYKRNDRWIMVNQEEWRHEKLWPVPKY